MTPRPPAVAEEELHELVDGVLPADRRPAVLAYLAANPAVAARVAAWQAQNEGLRLLFGTADERAVQWRRETAALARRARGGAGRWLPLRLAGSLCAAAVLGVIVLAGIVPGDGVPTKGEDFYQFSRSALLAHAETMTGGGSPVAAATGLTWVRPPDLTPLGWRLERRRPVMIDDRPGLQFIYREGSSGRPVSLIVGRPGTAGEGTFSYIRQGSRTLFTWLDGSLGYALVGDLSRGELLRLADAVHASLGPVLGPSAPMPSRRGLAPASAALHSAAHRQGT